jgi:glutamine synthetase
MKPLNLRQTAFANVGAPRRRPEASDRAPVDAIFGANVFGPDAMRQSLDSATIAKLERAATAGEPLDAATAEAVATALRDWAVARGATHYAHVFYPLNGQTAEKHESLFAPGADGRLLSTFNARCLVSGEPDASSFPSGGLRTTFEARGITAWDPRCPPYLVDNPDDPNDVVLAIPSTFASAAGDALDEKTPLARSGRALAKQAERVLALLGLADEGAVYANAGVEQEYFLIDRQFFMARPDLAICGRTLMGARPPKGQEFEDQYFGAIPERVKAYMLDFERELWRLGIPAQTRHNEVAPSQYEFVPYFERDHMASDHQHIVMQVMQRVATQHGFACLLHEKPFAGVNGSGKHVNWSVHTAKHNLFKAGPDPAGNLLFLVFGGAVVRAVHRYAPLLRAVVAGAGNDHRLGAHEAPPAIVSVFLGEKQECVFEELATGTSHVPRSAFDDRNRTSPFAFTGNKFEFRAVGSSQPVSAPLTVLNTAMAEALDWIAGRLEQALPREATQAEREVVARDVVGELYREHGAVVFNGDGYSEAWRQEAHRRGLPEITNSVDAFAAFARPEHVELFERYGVLTAREVHCRAEIYVDRYVKQIATESAVCLALAEQFVLPAAYRHQGELARTAAAMQQLAVELHVGQLHKATALVRSMETAIEALRTAADGRHEEADLRAEALYCRDTILPAMRAVRAAADAIETAVADDLWPLPAYREILFVK